MKYQFFLLIGLSILGIILGLMMVPKSTELALIRLKDKQFEAAFTGYKAQYLAGHASVNVVIPLTKLYLHYGDVAGAIDLMETFVAREPGNIEARRRLGAYYQYAQRTQDYLRTVETLSQMAPSAATLRELLDIYNAVGRYDDQIEVLRTIIRSYANTPDDFVALANMQATRGRIDAANATLAELEVRFPDGLSLEGMELRISLLLDVGDREAAFERAAAWIARTDLPGVAAEIAGLLRYKKDDELAIRLLERYLDDKGKDPLTVLALAEIEADIDRKVSALARMRDLDDNGILPQQAHGLFLNLTLEAHDYEAAFAVARITDPSALPDEVLIYVVEMAVETGRAAFADDFIARGGGDLLDDHPVLAAHLAMAKGDHDEARRLVDGIENPAELSHAQRLSLANAFGRLARPDPALDLLSELADNADSPDWIVAQLAALYIKLDRVAEGLRRFERLRGLRPSRSTEVAWAILATASGTIDPVVAWLHRIGPEEVDQQSLRDLYFVAMEQKAGDLARIAAAELYRRLPGPHRRLYLAEALLVSGRPMDALVLLREIATEPIAEPVYIAALLAAAKRQAPVTGELRQFVLARLGDSNLPKKRRGELVFALIEVKAYAAALPHLRALAKNGGNDWAIAYQEALTKLGRREELVTFLLRQGRNPKHSLDRRRSAAFGLLEAGFKDAAEEVFRNLASAARPDSPDVSQLLFLWGPRPGPEKLNWLEARAQSATTAAEQAAWLQFLVDIGGATRAARLLAQNPPPAGIGGPLLQVWLNALAVAGDRAALASLIETETAAARSAVVLRGLGRAAFQQNHQNLAARAYELMLEQNPNDREALRRTGILLFYKGYYSKARNRLEKYRILAGDLKEYESLFYLGEIYRREMRPAKAQSAYRGALAAIDAGSRPNFAMRQARALIMHRTGRSLEAVALFEELHKERPKDANLVADYADVLMEIGELERARQLLFKS